jgi:hypothetical protein
MWSPTESVPLDCDQNHGTEGRDKQSDVVAPVSSEMAKKEHH